MSPHGTAYRLGGDEFCVLLPALGELHQAVEAAAGALQERGETFAITASCGAVLLPDEATTPEYALQLADKRMYKHKHGRPSGAREQAHDVLVHILRAKQQGLPTHSSGVAQIAVPIGRRLGMNAEQIDELARAAALHDIGKVGIPDAILDKARSTRCRRVELHPPAHVARRAHPQRRPALRPVATIVRASHERWDGGGYPDGLHGNEIPLAARIIAVCDAYDAIVTDRCYRSSRPPEVARQELRRESGHQFDPAVVAVFLEVLDRPDAEAPIPRRRVRMRRRRQGTPNSRLRSSATFRSYLTTGRTSCGDLVPGAGTETPSFLSGSSRTPERNATALSSDPGDHQSSPDAAERDQQRHEQRTERQPDHRCALEQPEHVPP